MSLTFAVAWWRSSKDMGRWERRKSPEGKRASGGRPRSMTTSTSAGSSGWSSTRRRSSPGISSRSLPSSSSNPSAPAASLRAAHTGARRRLPRRRGRWRPVAGPDVTQEKGREEGRGIGWGGVRETRRRRWSGGGGSGGIAVAVSASGWREELRMGGRRGGSGSVSLVCDQLPRFTGRPESWAVGLAIGRSRSHGIHVSIGWHIYISGKMQSFCSTMNIENSVRCPRSSTPDKQ